MNIDKLFEDVTRLSKECGDRVREMVSKKVSNQLKADQSFVTEVDLEIEEMVRNFVLKEYPEAGIVGEEKADVNPNAEYQWIVDPIDGTQNLVHHIPTYGIVIGVFKGDVPIAGAINHPALHLEYVAAKNLGCYKNGNKILINDCSLQEGRMDKQEVIAVSTRSVFERSGEEQIFDDLVKRYPAHRVYYDIFSTSRAVEGQVAAVVEFNMKIWDIAATEILITEAGGEYQKVRIVTQAGGKPMYSIIAGKPSAVKLLCEELGGFKELKK